MIDPGGLVAQAFSPKPSTGPSSAASGDTLAMVSVHLKALAAPARLRIALLCARSELSVKELVAILGHSQPRVSQHLKILHDAGVVTRMQEGARAYHRLVDHAPVQALVARLSDSLAQEPALIEDLRRLTEIWSRRRQEAEAYFQHHARQWDDIRQQDIPSAAIDQVVARVVGDARPDHMLDIGCGTGHCMTLVAGHVGRVTGIDISTAMLAVARSKLENFSHAYLKRGDMTRLPFAADTFDLVMVSMVLRYADDPAHVMAQATRVMRPGGLLVVVELLEHNHSHLREDDGHRWLGFSDSAIRRLLPVPAQGEIIPSAGLACGVWWSRVTAPIPSVATTPSFEPKV